MKGLSALLCTSVCVLALCACGNEPPPKPAPKASTPVQEKAATAKQSTPAPAVQAKIEEAPANANPNTLLAERVKRALDDAKLQAAGIDVTVSSGVVSLFGTVPSANEKSRAAQIAGKVDGVKSVDNRIVVVRGS